jgi:hypothetical protein
MRGGKRGFQPLIVCQFISHFENQVSRIMGSQAVSPGIWKKRGLKGAYGSIILRNSSSASLVHSRPSFSLAYTVGNFSLNSASGVSGISLMFG